MKLFKNWFETPHVRRVQKALLEALKRTPRPHGVDLDRFSEDQALTHRAVLEIVKDPNYAVVKNKKTLTLMRRRDLDSLLGSVLPIVDRAAMILDPNDSPEDLAHREPDYLDPANRPTDLEVKGE